MMYTKPAQSNLRTGCIATTALVQSLTTVSHFSDTLHRLQNVPLPLWGSRPRLIHRSLDPLTHHHTTFHYPSYRMAQKKSGLRSLRVNKVSVTWSEFGD